VVNLAGKDSELAVGAGSRNVELPQCDLWTPFRYLLRHIHINNISTINHPPTGNYFPSFVDLPWKISIGFFSVLRELWQRGRWVTAIIKPAGLVPDDQMAPGSQAFV